MADANVANVTADTKDSQEWATGLTREIKDTASKAFCTKQNRHEKKETKRSLFFMVTTIEHALALTDF